MEQLRQVVYETAPVPFKSEVLSPVLQEREIPQLSWRAPHQGNRSDCLVLHSPSFFRTFGCVLPSSAHGWGNRKPEYQEGAHSRLFSLGSPNSPPRAFPSTFSPLLSFLFGAMASSEKSPDNSGGEVTSEAPEERDRRSREEPASGRPSEPGKGGQTDKKEQEEDELLQALTEIESMCPNCQKNGKTLLLLHKVPHFKEIILMSFSCPHCNYSNREVRTRRSLHLSLLRSDYNTAALADAL